MCYSQTTPEVKAIGQMSFVDTAGLSYLCSGTLLNDTKSDYIPYFLSANHCISKQSVASTLNINWFFHSTYCNSGVVNPGYVTTYLGATLLYSSAATDTSFMRLNDSAPAGTMFAGWSASTPTVGTAVTDIHHPQGDLEKISFGNVSGYQNCYSDGPGTETYSCNTSAATSSSFINVSLSTGTTEGGSSGSGLFKVVNGQRYLIGQLYGGSSSCSNISGGNQYGRFDVAYNVALSQYLDAGSKYALTVSKFGNGNGTVTSSDGTINCGQSCSAPLNKGASLTVTASPTNGSIFSGWPGACSGINIVCAVTMNAAQNVSATFTLPFISLGVALDNSTLIFVNDLTAPYIGEGSVFNFGGSAAQTGHIGNSQSSSLSTSLQGPGTLSFDWKVSSEKDYDIFSANLDGVMIYSWSGETNWYRSTIPIPAGSHTVKWIYSKDSSKSSGQDAGWLDHVVFNQTRVQNIFVNPGFENGLTGWSSSTANGTSALTNYTNPAPTNKSYARLCGYNNCADTLSQKASIPSNSTSAYLDFDVYISTAETVLYSTYDYLRVEIHDALSSLTLGVAKTFSNLDASSSWKHYIVDLSQYIGQTINLVFNGTTDSTKPSSFNLDSINLMVDGSAHNTQTIGAISFSPTTLAVGGTATVSATTTSGLAVSFGSMTPNICTVTGSTVTSVTAGTCTIAANQAGNASYNAAPQVTQSIAIGNASQISISDARVFAYAEANYSSIFAGTATAGQYLQYNYHYYPASRNYLAVNAGTIYILGPVSGGAIQSVGTVASFANTIKAWEATQAPKCYSPQC